MQLYIIRHADPDYARNTITDQGHREAVALSRVMESLQPTHLYTSPLGRARDTAGYTARATGLPLGVEEWTREIEGFSVEQGEPFGQTALWDYHPEKVRHLANRIVTEDGWLAVHPYDQGFSQVLDSLASQSDIFLAKHGVVRENNLYRIQEETDRNQRLAVFCHAGFGLTWLSHLLGIPFPLVYSSFFLWPSSVTTVLFEERIRGIATPRCTGLADITHLKQSGLTPQPRGLWANIE